MQARVVLALVELAEGPVEEIAGLACADREVARAHVEEMQRMMAAVSDAAPERRRRLGQHEAERPAHMLEARDGSGGPGEAAADH